MQTVSTCHSTHRALQADLYRSSLVCFLGTLSRSQEKMRLPSSLHLPLHQAGAREGAGWVPHVGGSLQLFNCFIGVKGEGP